MSSSLGPEPIDADSDCSRSAFSMRGDAAAVSDLGEVAARERRAFGGVGAAAGAAVSLDWDRGVVRLAIERFSENTPSIHLHEVVLKMYQTCRIVGTSDPQFCKQFTKVNGTHGRG